MNRLFSNYKKWSFVLMLLVLFSSVAVGNVQAKEDSRLILATTTSTENSGLLNELLPPFEKQFDVRVDVVSVGTGKAIRLAENGDADIILVHAKKAENKFVNEGYGVNRRDVMYNDFVILGPKDDPAGVKGMKDVTKAFQKISNSNSRFVSRGDDSGTNKKELSIWKKAGIQSRGRWYFETGQGMGASLNIANEKRAYVLTDRGTYLAYKGKLDLKIMVEGDSLLYNPYGIIPVNPGKYPHVNYQDAMALVGYITSQQGQRIIKNYIKFGKRLFNPSAIKPVNIK
ncbi:substrate-binding domain-containing protein [Selenihalanaerobacter shriftii]|uniref:Tungstate transport system substrate-binding protein n=1 Tax=Selenihalanaerobacter shriftii TaxID=142842 RepID=A0A1T4PAZ4_9FIRM|nr:substrate-binding domain-containing protein [Selenihalanaerobacter shriftii]SJZ88527.1 tungstate transport system substrate-binding protein [Selenihalanaerobacter shriftii]